MKSIKQTLAILVIASAVSAAMAQMTNVILQTDFDSDAGEGNFANNNYGYVAVGSSSADPIGYHIPAGYTEGIVGGLGVTNSVCNSATVDYTLLPSDPYWTTPTNTYVYAVLGQGSDFGSPISPITPTSLMSSFILSADIQVLGLLPQLTNANVTISKVQCLSNNTVLFDFYGDAGYVGSNYTHIAVPLSSLTYGSGPGDPAPLYPVSAFTNAAIVDSIDSFTIEFQERSLVGTIGGSGTNQIQPVFGFTTNGVFNVDNIQLAQTGNTVPTPTVEKLIWQANFDSTFPNDGIYGFNYRDGNNSATGTLSTNLTGGVGGSASAEYTVDLSSWSGTPPSVYSGFGVGAIESPLPYAPNSSNAASYRVYLSAKVGGVSAGVTNVPGVMDLLFEVPPGTLSPSNSAEAVVFDLSPTMTFTTNWQSYVFDNMPLGVNNGGSQAMFNQHFAQVNQLQVQVVPQGSPNIATLFGYDSNNTVDIDNIKVVQLVPGLAPLTMVRTNNQIQIAWTDPTTGGTAQLQSATSVAGPYVNVSGAYSAAAASPYIVPSGSQKQFFRTVWVP